MTEICGKERVVAALAHRRSDRPPVGELEALPGAAPEKYRIMLEELEIYAGEVEPLTNQPSGMAC